MGIIAALLLTLLVAGAPASAEAAGLRVKASSSSAQEANIHRGPLTSVRDPRASDLDPRTLYRDPRALYPDPRTLYRDPTAIRHRPDRDHRGHDVIHHTPVIVVPQPVVVVAPRRCQEPGYWAYSWVPQNYVSSVWVPGYYDSNALWVEAHYEPRAYTWGYYQPYWVPERWTLC